MWVQHTLGTEAFAFSHCNKPCPFRSSKYNVPLPALLFARHEERSIDPVLLSRLTPQEIAQTIRYQLLETFVSVMTVRYLQGLFGERVQNASVEH